MKRILTYTAFFGIALGIFGCGLAEPEHIFPTQLEVINYSTRDIEITIDTLVQDVIATRRNAEGPTTTIYAITPGRHRLRGEGFYGASIAYWPGPSNDTTPRQIEIEEGQTAVWKLVDQGR